VLLYSCVTSVTGLDGLGRRKYKNIRLEIKTRELLEKYRIEKIIESGSARFSCDAAVKCLLDEHYSIEKEVS